MNQNFMSVAFQKVNVRCFQGYGNTIVFDCKMFGVQLVRLFCEQKVIDEAKTDAYVYGYELLISSIVSILLVILMGYTNREIAKSLGLTDEVVRTRLFRGRKLLWKELSNHE